jgi:hypothetical protein
MIRQRAFRLIKISSILFVLLLWLPAIDPATAERLVPVDRSRSCVSDGTPNCGGTAIALGESAAPATGDTLITGDKTASNMTSRRQGITILTPTVGSTITDSSVLVRGKFDPTLGTGLNIYVNGYPALNYYDQFAVTLPVDAATTSVTANYTTFPGAVLASHTIPINVQPSPPRCTVGIQSIPHAWRGSISRDFCSHQPNADYKCRPRR